MKTVELLYGRGTMALRVPDRAVVLRGCGAEPLADPGRAVAGALENPIGSPPLAALVQARRPRTVAISVSDITRPVPNAVMLPPLLDVLNRQGVGDDRIVIVIGTGMHRVSTSDERRIILGDEIPRRIEVVDHNAHDPTTLKRISRGDGASQPVSVCRRFAEADFRIVTGLIEPHFMAGFSGGRKGVCPALVDLQTIQRFHGYATLADPRAENAVLDGNPCHRIALQVARTVGVDFLLNVAITQDRRMAGVYCGDLEQAHLAGCRDVERWTGAWVERPFDLVITSAGGYPLDQTFYQTIKGMGGALPALHERSVLLQIAHGGEGLGSEAYERLLMEYQGDWRRFLADAAASPCTRLDQWALQMQARVQSKIGNERLWFVSDAIPVHIQKRIGVTPLEGEGDAQMRAQRAIDRYLSANPLASVAVIPDGPYTLVRRCPA